MLRMLNNKSKTTVISLCYRTGTGKLCHMQSSSEDTDPFEWDYDYDECKDKLPTDLVGNDMRYLNFTSWERSVTLLTLEHRTPDWFRLRKFGFGGTTSESVVKTVIADEDWWLCDLLGIKRDSNTTEAESSDHDFDIARVYNIQCLNKLKVCEIKEIIENPLPPLQQGEKKLKSYYVRTLEEAIQPDGTFLVHNKPISIPAEEKVLKACLES